MKAHLWGWAALLAFAISGAAQDSWTLRFNPKVGLTLQWLIQMTSRRLEDGRAETEKTELIVRERVEAIRPNGNLIWVSEIVRGVVNGEPLPTNALGKTVAEITPLGLPVSLPPLPPPTEATLDDWLNELVGGITLAFPKEAVRIGQSWARDIIIGLKPPSEPRRITVTYRLDGREQINGRDEGQGTRDGTVDCLRITVQMRTPVRLFWRFRGSSVTVTGGARMEGTYWFDPDFGIVRQRRITVTLGYTKESEIWDGFQFVQRTVFVNQTTEVNARLVAP
ncbi:MAG: hypothetical protein PVTTEEND_000104 [Candidatus Fervidibacter sp.]|jgi:hypothetical protein